MFQLVLWTFVTASAIERESSSHLELLNLLHNFCVISLDTVISEHVIQLLAQPVGVGLRCLQMRATVERSFTRSRKICKILTTCLRAF